MSDQKLDRFRRLELPRAAGPDQAPAPTGTDARIEAVEGPGAGDLAGAAEPVSGGDLQRFRAPAERSLELDRTGQDTQPFLRCAACETDNGRSAERCTTCGADLDTEPQRQFNRRLWEARRAEAASEAETQATRKAQLEADRVAEAAVRRQAAEALAREVGESERRRLEREGYGPSWTGPPADSWAGGPGSPAPPPAVRWLRSLPPGWPVPVGLAALALPVVLYLASPPLGFLAGALLLGLFSPPRWRTWFDPRF